jgi:uncharacterized coiled-coil protein SlyX
MNVAVIDTTPLSITPFFKVVEVEDIHKSEKAGHLVMKTVEMVEVRIAGDKNYSPCFRTDEQWKREGNRTITYAERWPEQYRAFKEGDPQEAMGTPLEMLRPYGATPENVSLCRALKIYSIEALASLEDRKLKSLGMASNSLKEMAVKFMADRAGSASALSEIEALRARIAELEARSTEVPAQEAAAAEIDALVAESDARIAAMSDEEIKVEIAKVTGSRPKGNPSRPTLEAALRELQAA